MQLLDNTNFSKPVQKLIEIPDYLIINGHVYDKITLNPIPLNFKLFTEENGKTSISQIMTLYRTLWTNQNSNNMGYTPDFEFDLNKIRLFSDINDNSVFYIILCTNVSDYQIFKYKITKKDNNISIEKVINLPIVGTSSMVRYIYQNNNILLTLEKHGSGSYNYTYLDLLDKNNNTTTKPINSGNYSNWVSVLDLYINENFYYFLFIETNASYYIQKLNFSTKTNNRIFTDTAISSQTIITSNVIKINDLYYILKDGFQYTNTHHLVFDKIKINFNDDTVQKDYIEINLNGFKIDNSSSSNIFEEYDHALYHSMFTFKYNNIIYILCVVHSANYQCNRKRQSKIIVFKYINENTINVVSVTNLNVEGCKGVMEIYEGDPTSIVTLSDSGYTFWKFNPVNESYEKTYYKSGIYYAIGFDTQNRFYAQNSEYAIEILSSLNSITLKADFEEENYYKHDANVINTNIYFYALNYLGEYVQTSVMLQISGNAEFEDGKKYKIIDTDPNMEKRVPVKITDSGKLEVIITQYKGESE